MALEPKAKAYELVEHFYLYWINTDIYWNPFSSAKDNAIDAITLISDNSEYWQEVIKEIELLEDTFWK